MSIPDPATIDAVAAVMAEFRGHPNAYDSDRECARALADAGWLRTAEDRAVLDAAEEWTTLDMTRGGSPVRYHWACSVLHRAVQAAVRARRVAAGGTEAQP